MAYSSASPRDFSRSSVYLMLLLTSEEPTVHDRFVLKLWVVEDKLHDRCEAHASYSYMAIGA